MPALTERCSANIVKQRQLDNVITRVDSAGTAAYHVNSSPDERTIAVCKKYGVPINSKGRKVTIGDFSTFDFILCMDHENLRNLEKIRPKESKAKVALFSSFNDGKEIIDPYYGMTDGFEIAYQQSLTYSEGLLNEIAKL